MKKILVLNTSYKIKGGEDSNIIEEISFLKNFFEVKYLEYKNEHRLTFIDFIAFFTRNNITSNKLLINTIDKFSPDLVYIHNTWFKANLGIFKILKKYNLPTFIKIHNYRFVCTNFFNINKHIKNELFCFRCNLSKENSLYFNKYFQESFLKSFFVILFSKKYIKILKDGFYKVIVMSNFQKKYLETLGISENNIRIFANPISIQNTIKFNLNSDYIVYCGRISKEKGVLELIENFNKVNLKNTRLLLIGEGPMLESLKNKFNQYKKIIFLGVQPNNVSLEYISRSKGVVTATKMYEVQPKLISEAVAFGIPVLFPNFGGMTELVPLNYPLMFSQFDYLDFREKLNYFNDSEFLNEVNKKLIQFTKDNLDINSQKNNFSKALGINF